MKKILAACVMFILFYGSSSAQVVVTGTDNGERPATGTYQFLFKDRNSEEALTLTDTQIARLEDLRDDTKTRYISFSERTVILLPSKETINDPNFVPLTSKLYINEEINFSDYSNLKLVPFQ
jgi:hypothetical protein